MSNTGNYQAAVLQYRTDLIASQRLHDPDLTTQANQQRQADARAAARAKLREAIPQRPDGPDPRDAVLDALAPTTADQIAVQGREREKFEALLSRGAHLSQVIAQADQRRLAAVLDWLETSDQVLDSPDPQAAQAELRGNVLDRLAQLGHEGAREALATVADRDVTTAWADVLEGMVTGSPAEYGPRAVIYQHDREAYDGTLGMQLPRDDAQALADAERQTAGDVAREHAAARTAGQATGLQAAGQ